MNGLIGKRLIIAVLLIIVSHSSSSSVYATTPIGPSIPGCEFAKDSTGAVTDAPSLACLAIVIANAIEVALMFVGAVALIFLLYGSILFVVSRGDPKALEKAKKTMTYAIFGVIAVFGLFIVSGVLATALNIPNPLKNFTIYIP